MHCTEDFLLQWSSQTILLSSNVVPHRFSWAMPGGLRNQYHGAKRGKRSSFWPGKAQIEDGPDSWKCRHLKWSHGSLLQEILGMVELSMHWVLRFLTPDSKYHRAFNSEECLTLFRRIPKAFRRRFLPTDELSFSCYNAETKEHLKQWTSASERSAKKLQIVLSPRELMVAVSWNLDDVVYTNLQQKGKMVTGLFCAEVLGHIDAKL